VPFEVAALEAAEDVAESHGAAKTILDDAVDVGDRYIA
jgi:hypothetical protein